MLPITGADDVTTAGAHTVDVIARATGSSTWTANAELVASYFPFGGAGSNVLGAGPAGPSETPAGPGTVSER